MDNSLETSTIKALVEYSLRGTKGVHHVTRLAMYKRLENKLLDQDSPNKSCLAISHSSGLGKLLGLTKCRYERADYPEFNLAALAQSDAAHDFCVSDQVLEHIEDNPFTAFNESVRVIKPGGYVCHTTCFINPVHGFPRDFWRFTAPALSMLAEHSKCDVIEVGGWGNREAWGLINLGFRMTKLPDDESHPLYKLAMRNEAAWPIVTWVVAKKR